MPISGRLTDGIGGDRVVLFGLIVLTAATVALTRLGAQTPYAVSCAILIVRGVGLGCSLTPAMASAYTTISRAAIPARDDHAQRAAAGGRLDRHRAAGGGAARCGDPAGDPACDQGPRARRHSRRASGRLKPSAGPGRTRPQAA
jgi:hypothetical protein